jgi:hypothetical protein
MATGGEEDHHITMVGHPPTNPTTCVEISYAAREHYPPSPAESSEGWLEELGNVLDGGDEDLHAPTIAEQTTLLESFNSMRQRALQATGADIEGNIVELSRHTRPWRSTVVGSRWTSGMPWLRWTQSGRPTGKTR